MLFAGGLRPSFRDADGCYRDPDPADADAYHVAVSDSAGVQATFRALPLEQSHNGLCEPLLEGAGLDRLLRTVGASREDAWEGGGWAVDPAARSEGLGIRVLAAGVAVAERLGLRTMVGAAGTSTASTTSSSRSGTARCRASTCCRCPGSPTSCGWSTR